MVKRADVARLAGVSPAVVSYVLNGGPRSVSEALRSRVLAAVDELGYRPNALASSLRRGSSNTVGLLMPSPVNPYLAELADALEAELLASGYLVSIGITREDPKRELENVRALLDRRVDGLILLSSTALSTIRNNGEKTPPIVVIDHVPESARVSSVRVDNVAASAHAVGMLQDLGHRVIACLSGPEEVPTSQERIEGWRRQQQSRDFPAGDELIVRGDYTPLGGAHAAAALLDVWPKKAPRPTAMFVASDAQAIGVLRTCFERGIVVPRDLSIISFDGTQIGQFSNPPLTAIKQPIAWIVARAVDLLLAQIADAEQPDQQVTVGWEISMGGSVAPCPISGQDPAV